MRQVLKYALHHALVYTINNILLAITYELAGKTPDFLAILPGVQRGSAAQKICFLIMNIMELTIKLKLKGISVRHSSQVR